MLDPILVDYFDYVESEHAAVCYERRPRELCAALGIGYHVGPRSFALFHPEAELIVVRHEDFGSRELFSVAHEVAHILAHRGGYDRLIRYYHTNVEPRRHLEQVINHAAGRLLIPAPELGRVRRVYGETPEAILALATSSGASQGAAMRRWAWQDVNEYRAAFVAQGNYIEDATACRARLPFRRWERVPELHLCDPALSLLQLGAGRVMATVI